MGKINGRDWLGLNVGSGPHYAEGWCNTDILPAPKGTPDPDVLADIFEYQLTFEKHSFDKAYVGHVLEHIPMEDTVAAVEHIAWCVAPGGLVMAVGPCINRAIATAQPQWLLDQIRYNPKAEVHPWSHAWTPTEELTYEIMQESGLVDVKIVPISEVTRPMWPNPSVAEWQTAVVGTVSA